MKGVVYNPNNHNLGLKMDVGLFTDGKRGKITLRHISFTIIILDVSSLFNIGKLYFIRKSISFEVYFSLEAK